MVDALAPMNVDPPNLAEQTCGKHRKRPAAEDEDMDADSDTTQAAAASETRSLLLSALRAPTNPVLLSDLGPVMPVVVYTGPTRSPSQLATLSSDIAAEPDTTKKKTKHKTKAERSNDEPPGEPPPNRKSVVAKPADAKLIEAPPATKPAGTKTKKPVSGAASPPGQKPTAQASATPATPKKQAKPKPPAAAAQ
jgi:D-alanyl-D-alanine carboxypeptidase